MRTLLAVGLLLTAAACRTAETPSAAEAAFDAFGAPIAMDGAAAAAVPVADLLQAPESYVGRTVRFRGPVHSVCKVKGCWMRVGGDPGVLVRFKDYGFFVPLDAEGREAVVEGKVAVRELPVAEARHYLEDAGRHDEAARITAPVREVTFLADGVRLQKSPR